MRICVYVYMCISALRLPSICFSSTRTSSGSNGCRQKKRDMYMYVCVCIYIYIYVYMYVCMYIYIYIERERDIHIFGVQGCGV